MSALRIAPDFVGQFLGGKNGVAVACPRCGEPAWRKSRKLFVHDAVIDLVGYEPKLTVRRKHSVNDSELDAAGLE